MMEKLNYSPDYVLVASSDQSFCVAGIPQQKACILKKKKTLLLHLAFEINWHCFFFIYRRHHKLCLSVTLQELGSP